LLTTLMPQGDSRRRPPPNRLPSRPADVRVVSSFEATGLDERGWNTLARLGINSVFQTYQWHRSWWHTYGGRYEPLFVTVSDGHHTQGVAPLYVEETAAGCRVVRFVGDGRADYCDLLAGNDVSTVASMVRGLRDYANWDIVDLGSIPSQSPTVAMLKSLCEDAGFHVMVHDQFVCPTLLVRGHERTVHRILDKPSLRRRQNYFERTGRLGFRDLTAAADIEPHLDAFFDQHTARWSRTSTPSLFQEAANRTFYRDLMSRLDGTRWLLFSLIELGDQPIAFHYGFDYNDTLLWYKPSFDPAFAARSPGLVLVRHLIRRVLEDGRRELDFTIGDEPFKRRFTNMVRKTVNVQIFRNPALYIFERSRRGVLAAVRRAVTKVRNQ
jgi:CelD/BcsL family acetyltransferase involved in cellulose biosynthesis